jgi:serine/threonine-protein kinase
MLRYPRVGVAADTAVRPGDVLLGKYRVEMIIGKGGGGVVVRARHLGLGEQVAIKLMREDVIDRASVARFVREAQAAFKLKSEHVARVTDVGTLDDGLPYMVMELLEGMDLARVLQERGPLEPGVAVDYILQSCEALTEAHALGIVHRDVNRRTCS